MRRTYLDDPETGDFPGERAFASRVEVKYALHDAGERPQALVVAFSAAHPPDRPPRYYTHRALQGLPCPRLFVLDDHGPREPLPRPCWYLGRDRSFDVADSVLDLMGRITEDLGIERARVVTCGASKGGWAALYLGARFGAGHAIVGEPQVMLGKHLCQDENASIARHVAGDASEEASEFLDGLLFDAFRAAGSRPRVHLYSGRTLYYARDVLPLIRFLDELGVPCELELGDHTEHVPDLGLNFPGYLRPRIEGLLEEVGRGDGRPAAPPPGLAAQRP